MIAIASACVASSKHFLRFVRAIKNAPKDIAALQDEVKNLESIFVLVEVAARSAQDKPSICIPSAAFGDALVTRLDHAKEKLSSLNSIVRTHTLPARSWESMNRLRWVQQRSSLKTILSELKDLRMVFLLLLEMQTL